MNVVSALAPVLEHAGNFSLRGLEYIANELDGGDSRLSFVASVALVDDMPVIDQKLRVLVSPAGFASPITTCSHFAAAAYLTDRPSPAVCRAISPAAGVDVVVAKGRARPSGYTTTMVIWTGQDRRMNLVQLTVGPPTSVSLNGNARQLDRPALSENELVDLSGLLSRTSVGS